MFGFVPVAGAQLRVRWNCQRQAGPAGRALVCTLAGVCRVESTGGDGAAGAGLVWGLVWGALGHEQRILSYACTPATQAHGHRYDGGGGVGEGEGELRAFPGQSVLTAARSAKPPPPSQPPKRTFRTEGLSCTRALRWRWCGKWQRMGTCRTRPHLRPYPLSSPPPPPPPK